MTPWACSQQRTTWPRHFDPRKQNPSPPRLPPTKTRTIPSPPRLRSKNLHNHDSSGDSSNQNPIVHTCAGNGKPPPTRRRLLPTTWPLVGSLCCFPFLFRTIVMDSLCCLDVFLFWTILVDLLSWLLFVFFFLDPLCGIGEPSTLFGVLLFLDHFGGF